MRPYMIPLLLLCLTGCTSAKEETKGENSPRSNATLTENFVDTMRLSRRDFRHQTVCNGVLRAGVKSRLATRHPDVITDVRVKTGQRVGKGELLAVTEEEKYIRALEKAKRDLEKAEIEFADKLITLGYDDKGSVPEETLKRAEVTSGLFSARHQLKQAESDLADCRLYAPFAGVVADLDGKLYQKCDNFCNLIDESAFDVDFSVLESELPSVAVGYDAMVIPFAGDKGARKGRITAINPTVSDKGLVKVTARIAGDKGVMDGMNVKVIVERTESGQFVVPKDAVVERDGYNVVFLYRDGKAVWTYVDVVSSNTDSHAITGCERKETELHEGDVVVTSGNMNLADGTEIKAR